MEEFSQPELTPDDILAALPDAVALVDRNLILLDLNPAMEDLAGQSRTRLIGKPLKELFAADERLAALMERCLASGRTATDFDRPLARAGQPPTAVWVSAVPILDTKGSPVGGILVIRDFGNLQAFQQQMRRADKLASMGILAAGLAHEIRNPLGGIKGAAQLLSREIPMGQEHAELIVREAERIDSLLGQLQDLTQPRPPALAPVNIHELVDYVLVLLREKASGCRVQFERCFDPSLPPLEADRDQLIQVILNLVKNALEASPPGGKVTLTTRVATELALPAAEPGGKPITLICLEVADEGPGLPPGAQDRLFTPFFTTKADGAGLGLSVAHGIVERHGGRLEVMNGPRGGALARCYLPVEQPPAPKEDSS
jgi:two-component system nitrogen regulation sensor histidine kinase GlnL